MIVKEYNPEEWESYTEYYYEVLHTSSLDYFPENVYACQSFSTREDNEDNN